jgi:hypothetical protein
MRNRNNVVFLTADHLEEQADARAEEALKLRKEAQGTHGIRRDRLIWRARQAEIGAHMSAWLNSTGLQSPK